MLSAGVPCTSKSGEVKESGKLIAVVAVLLKLLLLLLPVALPPRPEEPGGMFQGG